MPALLTEEVFGQLGTKVLEVSGRSYFNPANELDWFATFRLFAWFWPEEKLNLGFYDVSQHRVHCGSLSTALIPTDYSLSNADSINLRSVFFLAEGSEMASSNGEAQEGKQKNKETE